MLMRITAGRMAVEDHHGQGVEYLSEWQDYHVQARAELALRLEPIYKAKGKAAQVEGGKNKVPQKSQ
jgi:hypothetical protein